MVVTSHRARRAALVAALIAATAATSLALPASRLDRDYAKARRDADVSETNLGARQAALAATRARLDAARTRYRNELTSVQARLRAFYVSPPPEPLIAALIGDPGDALARAELVQAAAEGDWRMIAGYREAVRDLDRAEVELEARKRAAAAEARLAAVRETIAGRRVARHRAAQRRAVTDPRGPVAEVPRAERGLPAQILAARSLPGDAPIDAATGQPLSFDLPTGAPVPQSRSEQAARRTLLRVMAYRFTPRRTANGEAFDPRAASAASRTLPFGTQVRLSMGGRTVTVRINDRGPYIAGVDLALSAAAVAGLGLRNTARVRAEVLTLS